MAKFRGGSRPQRGRLYGKTAIFAANAVRTHVMISVWYTIFYSRSAAQYSMLSIGSFYDLSTNRKLSASVDVRHFIREQRKILKTVCSQPWPMHIKINALTYVF